MNGENDVNCECDEWFMVLPDVVLFVSKAN